MSHYRSDRSHIQFLLFDVLGREDVYGHFPYDDVDPETARDVLAGVEAFARWPPASARATATRSGTTRGPDR